VDSDVAVLAENNLISIFFIFSTVANCTSSIFLHSLVPHLSVDGLFSLIIKELSTITMLSLLEHLLVVYIILLPLPILNILIEVLFLFRGEVAIKEDFIHVLSIPFLILFDVPHVVGIYIS
jgi:hypothetical protein